jgi:hypothetical protein
MCGGTQIKQLGWRGGIFEACILHLDNQFKDQNRKVIMNLDNAYSHVVSSTKVGKSHGFPTLELSTLNSVVLPPNATSVVQSFDQGIIASFKFQYKNELLQWFYHNIMMLHWRKVPNIRQAIIWSYEVWSELDAHIVTNCWRMVRILPATWNLDFALVDEREKNRMQEGSHELGALVSKMWSGDDEMLIKTYI